MQCRKKVFFKNFVLGKERLKTEADMYLKE